MFSGKKFKVLAVIGMLLFGFSLPSTGDAGEIYPVCKGPGETMCDWTCVVTCPDGISCCAARIDYLWWYVT